MTIRQCVAGIGRTGAGRAACILLLALAQAGCQSSANESVRPLSFGSVRGVATTGAMRLVTERERPGYPNVVCTEPAPDIAVAFDKKVDAKLKVALPDGTTPDGALILQTDEYVEKLDGRNAAVLALRDGLYAACQSYANGVIGQDAYAIILSQYGNLLVALVGIGTDNPAAQPAAAIGPQSTLSALVVACISNSDKTRLQPVPRNDLLNPIFCADVLRRALNRATAVPAARPPQRTHRVSAVEDAFGTTAAEAAAVVALHPIRLTA